MHVDNFLSTMPAVSAITKSALLRATLRSSDVVIPLQRLHSQYSNIYACRHTEKQKLVQIQVSDSGLLIKFFFEETQI